MAGFRNTSVRAVTIDPRHAGLGPIGHMGYFRRKSQPLWQEALAWFQQHPQPAGVHLHAALAVV